MYLEVLVLLYGFSNLQCRRIDKTLSYFDISLDKI